MLVCLFWLARVEAGLLEPPPPRKIQQNTKEKLFRDRLLGVIYLMKVMAESSLISSVRKRY